MKLPPKKRSRSPTPPERPVGDKSHPVDFKGGQDFGEHQRFPEV
jgi:hypothetical protein